VGEIDITVSSLVVTVEEGWLEFSGMGLLFRVVDPATHVTPRIHGPKSGSRESETGTVDPPLAAAALD